MEQIIRVVAIAITVILGVAYIAVTVFTNADHIVMPWWSVLGAGVVMIGSGIQRAFRN